MQYGIWMLPMNFERTETGGRCTPGCHVAFSYDRETPFGPTTAPADTRPAMLARGEEEKPTVISIAARDVAGEAIAVPAGADRTAVLLFVGNTTAPAVRLLVDSFKPALAREAETHLLIVCCGTDAPTLARALRDEQGISVPIIADATNDIADELDVRGWPVVVRVRGDGTVMSRISGTEQSLALKLAGYGAPTASPTTEPTTTTVSDGARTAVASALQVARQALDAAQPEQARIAIEKALQDVPDSTALKRALVQALSDLKRADDAIEVIRSIPLDALEPGERETLGARALISAGKWERAAALLNKAIERNPALAEAHYLMGQVHEQASDWQKAAQSYRRARELSAVPR
jgi:thioredoxin-like negative regulator of GroEL